MFLLFSFEIATHRMSVFLSTGGRWPLIPGWASLHQILCSSKAPALRHHGRCLGESSSEGPSLQFTRDWKR